MHKQVGPGEFAKKIDGRFYLFRNGAEAGFDDPIKEITKEGTVPCKPTQRFSGYRSWEYGFSKACLQLCPTKWKKRIGADWYRLLALIISTYSKNSYLLADMNLGVANLDIFYARKQLNLALASLGTSLLELYEVLSSICLIENSDTGERMLTSPTDSQIAFCQKLGLCLEEG